MKPSEEMAILMYMCGFKWRVQPSQWLHPYPCINRDAAQIYHIQYGCGYMLVRYERVISSTFIPIDDNFVAVTLIK